MESIEQVLSELKQINKKLLLVDADISLREKQVEELKQANARLLEKNLGKERRPAALDTQRRKILDIQNQIDELHYLKQSLQEERKQTESRLQLTQQKEQVERYKQLESDYLTVLKQTSTALSTFLSSMQSLNRYRNQQHPLSQLLRLYSELGKERFAEYGLDLPLIAARYTEASNWMTADFNHDLEAVTAETRNFVAQLEAVMADKRAYHKVEPQRTTEQQVIPNKSMRALGTYRILQAREDELAEQRGFKKRGAIMRE